MNDEHGLEFGKQESPLQLELVRDVEERAANAWPASVVQVLGSWRLRATPSVRRRRSNSAVTIPASSFPGRPVDVGIVEHFYEERGLVPRFQITPLSADLDDILDHRGWVREAPTMVQIAGIGEALDLSIPESLSLNTVVRERAPDDGWLHLWAETFHLSDAEAQHRDILQRIGPDAAYTTLYSDEQPVSVGLGVVERGWVGLFCMGTVPSLRRKGIGTTLLHALLTWARDRGAQNAYLQVEEDNHEAEGFYERFGFTTLYNYHYRTAPSP